MNVNLLWAINWMASPEETLTLLRGLTAVILNVPMPLTLTDSPLMRVCEIVANNSRRNNSHILTVVEEDSAINSASSTNVILAFMAILLSY